MANAALITTLSHTSPARAGFFHGHKTRKAVLDDARRSYKYLTGIACNPSAHWTEKRLVANGVEGYFATLRRAVKLARKDAVFFAECAAAHAADMDAARNASPADKISRQINCLEMADFHTAANRAEVARLQGELAKLAA